MRAGLISMTVTNAKQHKIFFTPITMAVTIFACWTHFNQFRILDLTDQSLNSRIEWSKYENIIYACWSHFSEENE